MPESPPAHPTPFSCLAALAYLVVMIAPAVLLVLYVRGVI